MNRSINLDPEQITAILGTIQNEILILTQKIKDMIRDKHTSYSQIETLTDRRNKLMEIMKVLEEKTHESK